MNSKQWLLGGAIWKLWLELASSYEELEQNKTYSVSDITQGTPSDFFLLLSLNTHLLAHVEKSKNRVFASSNEDGQKNLQWQWPKFSHARAGGCSAEGRIYLYVAKQAQL